VLTGPLDTRLYRFAYRFVPRLFRLLYRMDIRGAENIPESGAVVLASNHVSNIDPLFIGVASPRQVHFMAKSELWKFKPLGWIIERLGSFPVKRGQADREAVRKALSIVDRGAVLGIFPEGRRQPPGRLGAPQPGFALFSLRPSVVTVPVALSGTDRVMPGRLPRFPRVAVNFGPPLSVTGAEGRSKTAAHQAVADRWSSSEAALLGYSAPVPDPAGADRSRRSEG
jgi:1-acyl-sn-glycerol-3-phosphate acyltransferase